ncbi:DHS-like NAD/FAD-binding domain-containing protein [Dipodascopsis tothii]|uniref:DHS-like NAD/FAD-binding domain-containing protein n=1 Tax=Dipodascopsis tothii TaxID=44089 RepID=UPI0034CD40B2
MNKLRVPYNIKDLPPRTLPAGATTLAAAVAATADFLRPATGSTALITGAGVSVESGIPDYRGPAGIYTSNKAYRPIFYSEFVGKHAYRQRYWARSYLGWATVRDARPNRVHRLVGELHRAGWIASLVTQNVDGLHGPFVDDVTNLHGSLADVTCLGCRTKVPRVAVQAQLTALNPSWAAMVTADVVATLKKNPDGDLELPAGVSYEAFAYPRCGTCAGVLKPDVIFFGESLDEAVRAEAQRKVGAADKLLVVGSSLATYSAFRFLKESKAAGKRVGLISTGAVRGEHEWLDDGDLRVSFSAGDVLEGVVAASRIQID